MANARISNNNGQNGGKYVTDTSANTGSFQAVFAHTTTVISAMTSPNITGTLTSITVPAGSTYYCGKATSITLASGTATLYNFC